MELLEPRGGSQDDSPDPVWSRTDDPDLASLRRALAEMRRFLRPDGHLIAYTNILRGPVDPVETATIHEPLGNVVANLVEPDLEAAFRAAGFQLRAKYVVGTQWREHLEEHNQAMSRDLLRLARLRRDPDRIIERYGPDAYRTAEGMGATSIPRPLHTGDLRPRTRFRNPPGLPTPHEAVSLRKRLGTSGESRQANYPLTRPSQDHCGMRSPSGTSSADRWYRDIVLVAHAK